MPNEHPIIEKVHSLSGQIVDWRRQLHQYPELSFEEVETAKMIAGTLKQIQGMKVEEGLGVKTSVVGTLTSGDGPTIALRADMDALPIKEENIIGYASKHDGVMHACGHDAHTAILLGTAHILADMFNKGDIKGTVKFVFQPAEESTDEWGLSGSPYMVQAGVYNGVDAAVALHMCPWLHVGEMQMNDGYSMANVDVFQGQILGSGGHGAYPELGTDPIWMLGPLMQALHGVVARRVSALDSAVVSIGQIHAGTASNIIPTEVSIEGTIRSYKPEVRDLLADELRKAFSIVENLGGSYSFNVQRGEPALKNSPVVNEWVMAATKELYPELSIVEGPFGMGGDDFGYVTQILPGSMFFLGCGRKGDIQRDLHTPIFDIDESCLSIGAAILVQTAINFLKGDTSL